MASDKEYLYDCLLKSLAILPLNKSNHIISFTCLYTFSAVNPNFSSRTL